MNGRFNILNLIAAIWIFLVAFVVVNDFSTPDEVSAAVPTNTLAPILETSVLDNPDSIIAPYTDYILTQGPHGVSYGHLAIDLTAGNGAPIDSPISGVVTANYTDYLSNTVLVIENDIYTVTLMHGHYLVGEGENVKIGQAIGTESNIGNTIGFNGEYCYYFGLDCGYHTHLNIYDKRIGANINPLDVLPAK
jgi:murein DD-endopeptidase MepM/ murein hydrolase activator NlpD